MSEKERQKRRFKRNAFSYAVSIIAVLLAIIGLFHIGALVMSKVWGYEIVLNKPDTESHAPESGLYNSSNNSFHIMKVVDDEEEFTKKVQEIESNNFYEILDYDSSVYQKSDGPYGMIYVCIYRS